MLFVVGIKIHFIWGGEMFIYLAGRLMGGISHQCIYNLASRIPFHCWTPVCSIFSVFSSCTLGTSMILSYELPEIAAFSGNEHNSYFALPTSCLEQTLPYPLQGLAGCIAWQAHLWSQQGWFLVVFWRAWILLSVVLLVNRDGQITFKCLFQRLETWNLSRTVTFPCVENSSMD